MVKNCCVQGCKSFWHPNTDLSFFSFPFSNEQLLDKWLEVIPTKGHVGKYSYICSEHFNGTDFYYVGLKRILKENAIPNCFTYDVINITSESAQTTDIKENTTHVHDCENITTSTTSLKRSACELPENATVKKYSKMSAQEVLTRKQNEMRRRIKNLENRVRRREAKLRHTMDLVKTLKAKGKCTEKLEEVLLSKFSGFNLELIRNEVQNSTNSKTGMRYSEKVKEFASTLYFYSPKAYRYLRTILHLPHESTLRKMIGETICEAGFLNSVFNYLKEGKLRSVHVKDVGLIFDSMAIRSQVSVDKKENILRGNIDLGNATQYLETSKDSEKNKMAKEMLAFQIVSFSTKFKIPIAHFFLNGISAKLQAKLIEVAINKLYDIGIIVRSLTCDGTVTNINTLKLLGCDFQLHESSKITTFFIHPQNKSKIFAILDPCHMQKLCRNAFADKEIYSPRGKISFKYVEELHKHQEELGFKYANNLSSNHIFFKNKKMKVCLATQTISSGVADAIDYLRESGHPKFCDSEATTEFIRIFDRLFDMLNSRSAYGKGYKSPLSLQNMNYWIEVFKESENYIRTLKVDNKPLIQSNRKVFAIGYIINIHSFHGLALDLLKNIQNPLKYFLTYKCSQDHIELYFCCIRSRGGWNNNPTTMQALWAIRRLLYRNSITPSINGNCSSQEFESFPILEFRSKNRKIIETDTTEKIEDSEDIEKLMNALEDVQLSLYQENILFYIAGHIIQKFLQKCICTHCRDIVISVPNFDHQYAAPDFNHYSAFVSFINRGKLCMPSKAIFDIVKYCEKCFKAQMNIGFFGSVNMKERICTTVKQHFLPNISKMFHVAHPILETSHDCNELHEVKIINFIAALYTKVRLYAYAKTKTLEYLGPKTTMRHKLCKVILFNNV